MILRPGQPAIAVRPADDEAAGRIDVIRDLAVDQFLRQARRDDPIDRRNRESRFCDTSGRAASKRPPYRCAPARCPSNSHRHLALAVRPQPIDLALLPGLGQPVAECDGPKRSAAASVRACRCRHSRTSGPDRRRRFPCRPLDSHSRPGQCRGFACRQQPSRRRCRRKCPSDRRCIPRRESLAARPWDNRSWPRLVISPAIMAMPVVTIVSHATRLNGSWTMQGIEDAVGDLIGQFIGMPHADRFAGEQEFAGGHEGTPDLEMVGYRRRAAGSIISADGENSQLLKNSLKRGRMLAFAVCTRFAAASSWCRQESP